MKEAAIPFQLSLRLKSFTHSFSPDSFRYFDRGKCFLHISDVRDSSFTVTVTNNSPEVLDICRYGIVGHQCISRYLIAINVATLGLFGWESGPVPLIPYAAHNPVDKTRGQVLLSIHDRTSQKSLREIDPEDVGRSALLFLALCREDDDQFLKEYLKGVFHATTAFFDMRFDKDAFANFYRAFEYAATSRVLKIRKLSNEVKQLSEALANLGMDARVQDEFTRLYGVRCTQVMHAQRGQKNIDREDMLKMKSFLDLVLHKIYSPVWKSIMTQVSA